MPRNWNIRKRLGETVREFRLALGLSPKEFGDEIGHDQWYVMQLEDGTVEVDLATLEKCANTFGMRISELFDAVYDDSRPVMLVEVEDEAVLESPDKL